MKKINITISENTADRIKSIYSTQKEGTELAIENYIAVRDNALRELKGIFEKEELIALLDMYNGTIYEPKFAGPQFLAMQIADSERFQVSVTRHGANIEELLKKVKKLTHSQSMVLVEECWLFWYGKGKQEIEGFVSRLV